MALIGGFHSALRDMGSEEYANERLFIGIDATSGPISFQPARAHVQEEGSETGAQFHSRDE